MILSESSIRSIISETLSQPSCTNVDLGGNEYSFEIADNNHLRKNGLMNRESMPERSGMLFKFPKKEFHFFWMKNTTIPLLACYVDDSGIIQDVVNLFPHDLNSKCGSVMSRYVLEIPNTDLNRRTFKKGASLKHLIERSSEHPRNA